MGDADLAALENKVGNAIASMNRPTRVLDLGLLRKLLAWSQRGVGSGVTKPIACRASISCKRAGFDLPFRPLLY